MPFTLAHPAAVLPFRGLLGGWAAPSALVIGSCVPDLPYFIPFGVRSDSTHTAFGLFWFCLPMGLVAYFLFHRLIRQPISFLMPRGIRERLPVKTLTPATLTSIVVCLLLGAMTHTLWDSFTHEGAFFVSRIEALRAPLFTTGGYTLFGYKLLQHLSSVAGLIVIGVWSVRWYFRTPVGNAGDDRAHHFLVRLGYVLVLGLPFVIATIFAGLGFAEGPWLQVIRGSVASAVFAGGRAFIIGLLVYAVCFNLASRRLRSVD